MTANVLNAEEKRLDEAETRTADWKRWGCYLSEKAWGTVREDYSADGSAWDYFPFEHSHLKAYRWNEDGIAGICDRKQNICFAVSLWNGQDAILKERLFGLAGPKGNHGEDVKEYYYYLDKNWRNGCAEYSCVTQREIGRFTAATRNFKQTSIGATICCSTNTSTVTTEKGSAQAIRPDGQD